MRNWMLPAVLSAALWWGVAAPAAAHAFLDTAVPAVGSVVHGSPPEIRLHFTETVEPAFCSIKVTDADGKAIETDRAQGDLADATYLELRLPKLPPGRYKVAWHAISTDTHSTRGDFGFEVAE